MGMLSCYVMSGIEMWSVNAGTIVKVVQLCRTTLKSGTALAVHAVPLVPPLLDPTLVVDKR